MHIRSHKQQGILEVCGNQPSHLYRVARWCRGYCSRLRNKQSGFEHSPRTRPGILRQDTLLSQCFSLSICINGKGRFDAGGEGGGVTL